MLLIPKTAENQTRQESNFEQTHTHNPKEHQTIGLLLPPAIKQAVPFACIGGPKTYLEIIYKKINNSLQEGCRWDVQENTK